VKRKHPKNISVNISEPPQTKKSSKGFTLLEAIIALSIWMLLSVSVIFIWQFTSDRTDALITRQGVFENARGAMDILIMNLQMAQSITLDVEPDYTLRTLTLTQRNPQGQWHEPRYRFDFILNPRWESHQRLNFGDNEFARGIAMIRMEPIGNSRMNIRIVTVCKCLVPPVSLEDCECLVAPVIIEGSVDIRHKVLTVTGPGR